MAKVGKAAAITFLFHAPSVAVACLHQAAAGKESPCLAKYPGTQQEAEVDRRLGRCSFKFRILCGHEVSGFFKKVSSFDDDKMTMGTFFGEVLMWASRNLALLPQDFTSVGSLVAPTTETRRGRSLQRGNLCHLPGGAPPNGCA